MTLFISLVVVAILAVTLSRYMKLSSKYERSSKSDVDKKLTEWNAMDQGIDPTNEDNDGDDK
jgi:hypothetical protein